MPIRTKSIDDVPVLNLTSMIDVLLLLLVFFMVGTKFTETERKIGLKVPQVSGGGALSSAPEKKVVNVYVDGKVTLDGKIVTLPELTEQLTAARQQYADTGVLIRGDGEGRFQTVAETLNACKQAGIAELAISVTLDSATR